MRPSWLFLSKSKRSRELQGSIAPPCPYMRSVRLSTGLNDPIPRSLLPEQKMAAAVSGVWGRLLKPSGSWATVFPWRVGAVAKRCLTTAVAANKGKLAARAMPRFPQVHFSTSSLRFVPAVTQHAPYFKGTAVVNGDFKELSLDDFKGKYLVLFFYPLDFTFVCPTEIIAFSDKANEFHDVNCEVVAVSVDSHFCHLAWINTPRKNGGLGHMNIPVLSDLTKQISRDYGVLLEGPGLALRGLFIIDPNGIVRHLSINDLPVGRSVEETLRLVKAFQFVESHGEVCPANWTPNSPTIKPTPEESKDYFEKVNK